MKKTRLVMAALAATFLSTAAFSAPPSASQVSVPQQAELKHHGKMKALFGSPDAFMMFRLQLREATHGMSHDQKKAYRKAEIQKIKAMNGRERDAYLQKLEAKWDALPAERKQKLAMKMERHAGGHHGRHHRMDQDGQGYDQNQNYDQSGDDMGPDQDDQPPRDQSR